jgi:hypothetical protein
MTRKGKVCATHNEYSETGECRWCEPVEPHCPSCAEGLNAVEEKRMTPYDLAALNIGLDRVGHQPSINGAAAQPSHSFAEITKRIIEQSRKNNASRFAEALKAIYPDAVGTPHEQCAPAMAELAETAWRETYKEWTSAWREKHGLFGINASHYEAWKNGKQP